MTARFLFVITVFLCPILIGCGKSPAAPTPSSLQSNPEVQTNHESEVTTTSPDSESNGSITPLTPEARQRLLILAKELSSGDDKLNQELDLIVNKSPDKVSEGLLEAMLRDRVRRYKLAEEPFGTAKEHLEKAYSYEKEGLLDVAQRHFEKSIEMDANVSESYAGLGRCKFRLNDVNGAIAEYEKAIKLAPDRPGWRLSLADAYFAKGDRENALAAYKQALEIDPKLPAAEEGIARVHWANGEYKAAKDAIDHCISLGGKPDPQFVSRLEKDLAKASQ